MPFFEDLHKYCELFTTLPSPVLEALERETHLKTLAPQMLSGRLQGGFLSLISKVLQPQSVLEIGTFTGYATICLAQGLRPGGVLQTIEGNPELEYIIRKYLQLAGLEDQVQLSIGDAKVIVPTLNGPFDLVFIDAGKADNSLYFDLVIDKIRSGGILIADNVLWSGKVLKTAKDTDTQNIQSFNQKVLEDDRVENTILPIRDGILIARKK